MSIQGIPFTLPYNFEAEVVVQDNIPVKPTILEVNTISDSELEVVISSNSDLNTDEYQIERDSVIIAQVIATHPETTFLDGELEENTQYEYRARGVKLP